MGAALRPGVVGFSCCHPPDPVEQFDERIDYILARGLERHNRKVHGQVSLLGEVRAHRIDGPAHPIWPSDHPGLVARLDVATSPDVP